jgi:hypothetical protein
MQKFIPLLTILLLGQPVWAESDVERLSQSTGTPTQSMSSETEMTKKLEQADIDIHEPLSTTGNRTKRSEQTPITSNRAGQRFTIHDARVEISRDYDGDGYYHYIKVYFDADVSHDLGWVYAKLLLSLDGGPWSEYFTTDEYSIDGDAAHDEYVVVTRLLDGYPPGYYDLLIELYDSDNDRLADEYGPNEDIDLVALPLEDSLYDEDDDGGGGSVDLGFILLGLVLVGRSVNSVTLSRTTSAIG